MKQKTVGKLKKGKAFSLVPDMDLRGDIFTSPLSNSTRQGCGEALVDIGKEDPDVVVLTADLAESTRTDLFAKQYPERFFDVGIAEQNMMNIAAGLALSGKVPFAATFGIFATGRAWDALRTTIAYSKANVKVIATHTGVSIGQDGATHQSLSDLSLTRAIPNFTIISPCDYEQAKKAAFAAAERKGPVYVRLGRPKQPIITTENTRFEIGKADVYAKGSDVMIIATGEMVYESLIAARKLTEQGISTGVLNMHTIKPLDEDAIARAAGCKLIVTAEDHYTIGGLGSAVAEVLSTIEGKKARQVMIGVCDVFGESGSEGELMKEFHLKSEDIVDAVRREF